MGKNRLQTSEIASPTMKQSKVDLMKQGNKQLLLKKSTDREN